MKEQTILQRAQDIIYDRSEEKERKYGPMEDGMREAAQLASIMSRKQITAKDMYHCLIALKLSRAAYSYNEDNYLDLVAYAASLNDYLKKPINTEDNKPSSSIY